MIITKYEAFILERVHKQLTLRNQLNQNQWALQGNPCGITCTLANNVRVQMRYDYDATNGFHVDAYKNGEHHVYVMGSPSGAKTGPGNVGIGQYTTSLGFMNNRYRTQDQQGMVATFLSGVI